MGLNVWGERDVNHLEGHYYVGLLVNENLTDVPFGMEYIEIDKNNIIQGEI
jgi:hypothetical protein